MNLKDLLMHYQNDFDTIEEIYCPAIKLFLFIYVLLGGVI